MELTYFLDTYAIHEMIAGNPEYRKYTSGVCLATTQLNLMETYYILLSRYGEKTADTQYDNFREYCIPVDDESVKEAMKFRFANKSKSLSYVDCIGYTLAGNNGMRFLTGDKQFMGLPNVEHVK